MKKYIKWSILGVVAIGLIALGIHRFGPKRQSSETVAGPAQAAAPKLGAQKLLVRHIVVKPGELVDGINISGSLIPDEEVGLCFETSGKITEINFEEGTSVRKGTLLAKINDAPLQAQLKKLEAQYQSTSDRLDRQRALFEKDAVSKETYQEAEATFNKLQADIEEIKARIAQTEMRAPFDGIVGLRQVSVGAYASPNTVVATLTSTRYLKVEFSVPERYAGTLLDGASLSFKVEGDMQEHNARVYATNSKVDATTRTFTVRARYDNADGKLVPGRYVSVALNTRTYPDAIAVPSEAIISEMGIDKVFLYKNGKAVPTEIRKGLRTDSQVQVLEGLVPGDTVITSGTMQLRTGQMVDLK